MNSEQYLTVKTGRTSDKMADPSIYSYPSPLEGWENSSQLPDEKAEDGKSESITVLDDFQALERFLKYIKTLVSDHGRT